MKKSIFTIAIIAMLGLLTVSCHDEPVDTITSHSTRNVVYMACGEPQNATVTSDDEWYALLNSLLDAVDNGCAVTFWNPDASGGKTADTVTISTPDRQQAYIWGEEMYDQGYTVSIIFDSTDGVYNGTAIQCASTYQRLASYLQGTWVLDNTGPWHLGIADYYYWNPWDTLPNMENAYQERITNYSGTCFDPSFYREERLQFSFNNVIAPYPNHIGWINGSSGFQNPNDSIGFAGTQLTAPILSGTDYCMSPNKYDSCGYFDSVMVYHYYVKNDFTINVTASHPVDLMNFITWNVLITGDRYIIPKSPDYMIIYGYSPRFYKGSNLAFGFIRQH